MRLPEVNLLADPPRSNQSLRSVLQRPSNLEPVRTVRIVFPADMTTVHFVSPVWQRVVTTMVTSESRGLLPWQMQALIG